MSYEEPTQQLRRNPPPTPMPAAMNPASRYPAPPERSDAPEADLDGATETLPAEQVHSESRVEATGVLPLDELLGPPPGDTARSWDTAAATDDTPTWTAMPVVTVRSDTVAPGPVNPRPAMRDRVIADARTAWDELYARGRAWTRRDDNGIMLTTALMCCLLLLVVIAYGH